MQHFLDQYMYITIHSNTEMPKQFCGNVRYLLADFWPFSKTSVLFAGMNDKLFLVDFGLASRYLHLGIHRPFEPDQRSAHEGTLEYVSRDGHLGCVSRRGDMECLLYVIIEWLGGHLPWDTDDDER